MKIRQLDNNKVEFIEKEEIVIFDKKKFNSIDILKMAIGIDLIKKDEFLEIEINEESIKLNFKTNNKKEEILTRIKKSILNKLNFQIYVTIKNKDEYLAYNEPVLISEIKDVFDEHGVNCPCCQER
ncbi:hypothetical protein FE773_05560 [Caminibacter mediatlanticus TB-2]|uniref:Argininosuccinate lyase n=1 Tax=Caminibacter mediatlanticus TB-2 TaxID=391592 RepID=A0AAI9AHT4_9BACT|nr:hypothetical protein [Caminibacter mediatlanticus]EDM23767.1 argininosuccinate lyase [Caminibacter mediatlanticus TB-2]QCT94661.1 hypothetical protein FE773_05560 [Caminibacter mediatlanticus TB-2]